MLDLSGARITRSEFDGAPSKYCVEVELQTNPPKSYYFCAKTEDSLLEWIECFKVAANRTGNDKSQSFSGKTEAQLCNQLLLRVEPHLDPQFLGQSVIK